mmetsp:Transcript_2347/g.3579  ORF Transcript_2347/g.3579 Transcript_2347/m.3579 type:complete len:932 (+) Transcript_2347:76-2871(+)
MFPEETASSRLARSEEDRVTEATRWTEKAARKIEKASFHEVDDARNIIENTSVGTLSLRDEPPLNDETRERLLSEARAEKARLLAEIQKLLSEELGFDVGDVGNQVIEATNASFDDEELEESEELLDDTKYEVREVEPRFQSKDEGEIDERSNQSENPRDQVNPLIERENSKEEIDVKVVVNESLVESEKEKPMLEQHKTVETAIDSIACQRHTGMKLEPKEANHTADLNEDETEQEEAGVELNGLSENDDNAILPDSIKEELEEEQEAAESSEKSPVKHNCQSREQALSQDVEQPKDEGVIKVQSKTKTDKTTSVELLHNKKSSENIDEQPEPEDAKEKHEAEFMKLSKSMKSLQEIQTKRWEGLRAAGHVALKRYLATGWKLNGKKCMGEHCDGSPIVEKADTLECLVCGGNGSGKDGVYTGVYTGVHTGVTNELNVAKGKVDDTKNERKLRMKFKCVDGPDIFSCGIFYTDDDIDLPSDYTSIMNKNVSESEDRDLILGAEEASKESLRQEEEEELSQLTAEETSPWDGKTLLAEVDVVSPGKNSGTSKEHIDNDGKKINNAYLAAAEPQENVSKAEEITNKKDNEDFNQMYQRELASQEIGRMLIDGWTILNESCTNCDMPILGGEKGRLICVLCGPVDANDDASIESEVDDDQVISNSGDITIDKSRVDPHVDIDPKKRMKEIISTPKCDPPAMVANERLPKQYENLREESKKELLLPAGVEVYKDEVTTGIALSETSRNHSSSEGRHRGIASLGTPEEFARSRVSTPVPIRTKVGLHPINTRKVPDQSKYGDESLNAKPVAQALKVKMKEFSVEKREPPCPESSTMRLARSGCKEAPREFFGEKESSNAGKYSKTSSSPIESITISSPRESSDVAAEAFNVILERMEQCKARILASPTEVQVYEISLIERLAAAAVAVKKFSAAD